MWLFTKTGFYSIVRKTDLEWHIRARAKHDLENLNRLAGEKHKIHTSPHADYRYRIVCTGTAAKRIIARLADDIDYANFKSQIAATPDQTDKLAEYSQIWEILYRWQHERELRTRNT